MKHSVQLFFVLIILTFVFSCKKYEGEGGTSSISGKVYVLDYNSDGELKGEYYAEKEDVFIIYGNDSEIYDDTFETSYEGSYIFKYLQKGSYKIFVYSDCDSCDSGKKAVFAEVEITENYKEYVLDSLIIIK